MSSRARLRPDGEAAIGIVETRLIEVLSAYANADDPVWEAPTEDRLADWFAGEFLEAVPPDQVNEVLISLVPPRWAGGEGFVVEDAADSRLQGRLGHDFVITATVDPASHLINGLQVQPAKRSLEDPRLAHRPWTAHGAPTELDAAQRMAEEHGLVGIVAANSSWTLSGGYVDLEAGAAMDAEACLPAYSITKLFTTVAVLQLVAQQQIGLDDPATRRARSARASCSARRRARDGDLAPACI